MRTLVALAVAVAPAGRATAQGLHQPVHVTVQVVPPYGLNLSDYYSGARDRLLVTLMNRDQGQGELRVRLRVTIKNGSSFFVRSRDELVYPIISLPYGMPFRLTGADLAPYLAPDRVTVNGYLKQGKLPTGMTEFIVETLDYATGRPLSMPGTGRAWLETKQPPMLDVPRKDEQVAFREPQHIRFQWMPRHQGMAQTEYEFTLKELPDNGSAPQSSFLYGNPVYQTRQRLTTLNYTHLEPLLAPGKMYGWQVRAVASDGIDEIGMFENGGFSEVSWFRINVDCPPPTGVKATAGYKKMTIEWQPQPTHTAFVVEYRPKSENKLAEWTSVETRERELTATGLTPGWMYEYRVGALTGGFMQQPVFSPVGEVTLPDKNEERLARCGQVPVIDLSNQTPQENLSAGDVVIIGGDFPMTITQVIPQGNGWFSGKGWITMPWIFDVKVAVKFNRLRVNTDNRQIDGEVETEYDPDMSQIARTNELDGGGRSTTSAGIVFGDPVKLDFVVPPIDKIEAEYDQDTDALTMNDSEGVPHEVPVPKNNGKSVFPMIVVDKEGNKYQVDVPPGTETSDTEGGGGTSAEGGEGKSATPKAPVKATFTRVEDAVGEFDTEKLDEKAGVKVEFAKGAGRWAFDTALEGWYKTAQLLKPYYTPFGKFNGDDYIAPWKLVPVGESDTVEAEVKVGTVERGEIKFFLKDGKGVVTKHDDKAGKWTLTLPSVSSGETYEVFAIYRKDGRNHTVGKLGVVSYPKQPLKVTLVPVYQKLSKYEGLDIEAFTGELNKIYAPYGVTFTVDVDDEFQKSQNWEWDLDGDHLMNLNGSGFFSNETAEMKALRKAYQAKGKAYDKNAYYLFVMEKAKFDTEPDAELAGGGDMPRGKQFGYLFMQGVDSYRLGRLAAHELGHGIFTLAHTFDVNYAGGEGKLKSENLMSYGGGTELAAFQWNVMANPAPLTWFDSEEDGMAKDSPDLHKQQIVTPRGVHQLIHEVALTFQNEQDQTIAFILPDETVFYWVDSNGNQGYFKSIDKPSRQNSYIGYCENIYNRKAQPITWGIYLASRDVGQFALDLVSSPGETTSNLANGIWKIVTLDFDMAKTWDRIISADLTDASYVVSSVLMGYLAGPRGKKLLLNSDVPKFGEFLDEVIATSTTATGKLKWTEVLELFKKGKAFEASVSQHLNTIYPANRGYTIARQVHLKVDGVTTIADDLIYNRATNKLVLNESKFGTTNTLSKNQRIVQDAIKQGRQIEIVSIEQARTLGLPANQKITISEILRSNSIDGTITNGTVKTVWKKN